MFDFFRRHPILTNIALTVFSCGLGIIVTAYYSAVYEKVPALTYEILSNANVLAVQDQPGALEISYEGKNVSKEGRSLSVIVLRVTNTGQTNIRTADFNDRDPLGFRIKGGVLAGQPELVATSNNDLKQASPLIPDFNFGGGTAAEEKGVATYNFKPVFLDRGDFFSVKLVVIHEKGKTPSIEPVGKVSGISAVPVIQHDVESTKQVGFWQQTLGGNVWSHCVRIAVYFLGGVCILAYVVVALQFFDRMRRRQRMYLRLRQADSFLADVCKTPNEARLFEPLTKEYATSGLPRLIWIRDGLLFGDSDAYRRHPLRATLRKNPGSRIQLAELIERFFTFVGQPIPPRANTVSEIKKPKWDQTELPLNSDDDH